MSYLSIGINILAGLSYTPWMIRQIGQAQYGLYTLATSVIALFMVDFGLSSATSRYVSKLHAEGDEIGVNNFLGVVCKLYIAIDAVIFVVVTVMYFLLDEIYVRLTPRELEQFRVVYLIVAMYSLVNFPFITLNGILTGYEKFIQIKLADVIYRILIIVLMVIALTAGFGLYALVTVNAFAGLLTIVYKLIVIRRETPVVVNFSYREKSLYKEIFSFSIWSTVAALAQRLVFNITPSILGIVAGAADIAVFGVIVLIESYAFIITNAINGMFMPRIARIYSEDNPTKKIEKLMLKVGRFQYMINGLIVAGFTVVGKEFIGLWMGEDYLSAYFGTLLVLVPGLFFSSLQIGHTAVFMTKQVHLYALINLAVGCVNIILSPVLASLYGVIGACISIFLVYMIRAVLLNLLYDKKLGIDMRSFARKCYIKMSIPIVASVTIGVSVCRFVSWSGWLGFVCKSCIVALVYIVIVACIVSKKENR